MFKDSSAGTRRLEWTVTLSNWYWHSAGSFQANYGWGDDCKIAYWSWVLVWTLPPLSVKHSWVLPGVITSRNLPKIPPHASSLHSECWLSQSLCNTISSPSPSVFNGWKFLDLVQQALRESRYCWWLWPTRKANSVMGSCKNGTKIIYF